MDVSKNSGTPKSSILIRFSIIKISILGLCFPIFGNIVNISLLRKHCTFHGDKGLQKTCTSSTLNSWRLRTSSSMWGSQWFPVYLPIFWEVKSFVFLLGTEANWMHVLICQEIFRKHCTFVQTFPSYTYFYITLNVCRLSSRKRLKKEMKSSTSLLLKIGTVPGASHWREIVCVTLLA